VEASTTGATVVTSDVGTATSVDGGAVTDDGGALVGDATVVGAIVVGATVVGATVVGATVVGATVVVGAVVVSWGHAGTGPAARTSAFGALDAADVSPKVTTTTATTRDRVSFRMSTIGHPPPLPARC